MASSSASSGEPTLPECAEDQRFVFVITHDGDLYAFDPSTGTFSPRGRIGCLTGIHSMAVDRHGIGYVTDGAGRLARVEVRTASCEELEWPEPGPPFPKYSLGFLFRDGVETLWMSHEDWGRPSEGLATLVPETMEASFVTPYADPSVAEIELSSSDDGRLLGLAAFLTEAPAFVEVDVATGAFGSRTPVALSGESFTMAYWQGAFYVFAAVGQVTTVYRHTGGGVGEYVANFGQEIVATGTTTCP